MSTSPIDNPPQQHSKYWLDAPNTVILQVENMLYRIDPTLLKKSSDFWDALFTLPLPNNDDGSLASGHNQNVEGQSEANPIHISYGIRKDISNEEFEHLLDYFENLCITALHHGAQAINAENVFTEKSIHVFRPPPYNPKMLKSVLKMGTMFTIESAQDWAEHYLGASDLEPCECLQLAREFNIPAWVHSAITALIYEDPILTSWERVSKLGLRTYYILTKARDTLVQECLNFSLYASKLTPIACLSCSNHAACHSSWKAGWWNIIAQKYLPRSPHPLPLKGAMGFIKALTVADFPGIHPMCLAEAVKDLAGVDQFGLVESGVVEDAVAAVQGFNESQTLYYRVKA